MSVAYFGLQERFPDRLTAYVTHVWLDNKMISLLSWTQLFSVVMSHNAKQMAFKDRFAFMFFPKICLFDILKVILCYHYKVFINSTFHLPLTIY